MAETDEKPKQETQESQWQSISDQTPPLSSSNQPKPYVLAVDAKGRMSIGYAYRYSTGELGWIFAKPIGQPTHWMPLPSPPQDNITSR